MNERICCAKESNGYKLHLFDEQNGKAIVSV